MDPLPSRPDRQALRIGLARRVRADHYGQHGIPLLAQALRLSSRRWVRDEAGAPIPAEVVLRFLELTAVLLSWLLSGSGPQDPGRPMD